MDTRKQQFEENRPEIKRTKRGGFWGIFAGGVIGIFGFWISQNSLFILLPFIVGLLGFVVGFAMDKKVEADKKKQVFRNK